MPEHRSEPGERKDIFIAPPNLTEAMHGDRVVARIERQTERGLEGRIIRILQRSQETVVGRFEVDDSGLGYVVPFDRRILTDIHVPTGQWSSAEPGEMVLVEITRWPTASRGPVGRVVEVLGRIDEPGVDTQIIIRKHGIPDTHSEESIEEAKRLGGAVKERDLRGRTDFRPVTTVTIDGEHARDFDDAITIERLANGQLLARGAHRGRLALREGGQRARRGSLRARHVGVLPRARGPHVPVRARDRAVQPQSARRSARAVMPDGSRSARDRRALRDARRRHQQRCAHDLHGGERHPDRPRSGDDGAVRGARADVRADARAVRDSQRAPPAPRGAIDFDLPETEVVLSEFGEIEAIIPSERNVAHRLIEEFMLLANETVASHLVAHDAPALHRVHEAPDVKKVADFEEFITTLGYSLAAHGHAVRPKHFQKLIDRMRGTPEERPIAALMLRTMQKARYDAAPLGHFGLAAEHYTHFTSPIRRYPDLVVHRMLRASRHGEITEARREELDEELPEIARHTSEMERRADEAERELLQWKKVRFMADKVGDEYHGYITGVAPFGLFVELIEHYVEGLVHISSMADDYYRFVEQQHTLRGENTKRVYRLGDKVLVQVVRVDMERRQVDLGLVEILEVGAARDASAPADQEQGEAEGGAPRGSSGRGAGNATNGRRGRAAAGADRLLERVEALRLLRRPLSSRP